MIAGCWDGAAWQWNPAAYAAPHWSEAVVEPPRYEPVTLAQVKHRLRIATDVDDADLDLLIRAARRQVEETTRAVLVSAVYALTVDAPPLPGAVLYLPRWPVQSVASVTTYGTDGSGVVLDPSAYVLDADSKPARLVPTTGWPTTIRAAGAIRVEYLAGFASPQTSAIDGLTWSAGVVTASTTSPHGFVVGDRIVVRGALPSIYNNTYVVATASTNQFSFALPLPTGWPAPPDATGAIVAFPLPAPDDLLLAVMALVTHYYDPLRAGLTTDTPSPLPFGYDDLTRDRLEFLA